MQKPNKKNFVPDCTHNNQLKKLVEVSENQLSQDQHCIQRFRVTLDKLNDFIFYQPMDLNLEQINSVNYTSQNKNGFSEKNMTAGGFCRQGRHNPCPVSSNAGMVTPALNKTSVRDIESLTGNGSSDINFVSDLDINESQIFFKGIDFIRVYRNSNELHGVARHHLSAHDFFRLRRLLSQGHPYQLGNLNRKHSIARVAGIHEYDCKLMCNNNVFIYFTFARNMMGELISDAKSDLYISRVAIELTGGFFDGMNLREQIKLLKTLYKGFQFERCSRIDVALDDFSNELDIQNMFNECRKGNCTKTRKGRKTNSQSGFQIIMNGENRQDTLTIGGKNSTEKVVFYHTDVKHNYEATRMEVRFTKSKAEYLYDLIVLPMYHFCLSYCDRKKNKCLGSYWNNIENYYSEEFNVFDPIKNEDEYKQFTNFMKQVTETKNNYFGIEDSSNNWSEYERRLYMLLAGFVLGTIDFKDNEGKYQGSKKGIRLRFWSCFIARVANGFTIRNKGRRNYNKSVQRTFNWMFAKQCRKTLVMYYQALGIERFFDLLELLTSTQKFDHNDRVIMEYMDNSYDKLLAISGL